MHKFAARFACESKFCQPVQDHPVERIFCGAVPLGTPEDGDEMSQAKTILYFFM